MADDKVKGFEQAKQELERILAEFDRDEVTLDALVPRLRRAKELIEFCTKRIKQVEGEANDIVRSLEPRAGHARDEDEKP